MSKWYKTPVQAGWYYLDFCGYGEIGNRFIRVWCYDSDPTTFFTGEVVADKIYKDAMWFGPVKVERYKKEGIKDEL